MKYAGRRSAAPMGASAARRRGRRRGRPASHHTIAKVLTSSLLVLGLITGLGVTYLYQRLNGNIGFNDVAGQLENRPDAVDFEGPQDPLNILVMGSDSREGQGNALDSEGGGGSDTTILMHLSADRRSAYGVSIPRDTLVDRPDCRTPTGEDIPGASGVLWNEAFNVGGAACTIQQFEQVTGVRIDNYVVVDFAGFQSMVDAVGGVEICVPEEIDDPKTGLQLAVGTQNVEGLDALNYVRARYNIGNGSDTGRIKRQQAFVASMAKKVVSGGVLGRPDLLFSFLDAATKSLDTDYRNLVDIAQVGGQFQGVGLRRLQFITVPSRPDPDDSNRIEWLPEAADLWSKVAGDAPLGAFRQGAITAADDVETPADSPTEEPSVSAEPSTDPSADPSADATASPTPNGLTSGERADVGLCG